MNNKVAVTQTTAEWLGFDFNEFGKVRATVIDGEPWFAYKDVAKILGLETDMYYHKKKMNPQFEGSSEIMNPQSVGSQSSRRSLRYGLNEVGIRQVSFEDNLGRMQTTNIIDEANMLHMIMRSNKPEAVVFQDWVCRDVIPTIRRTGTYYKPYTEDGCITFKEFADAYFNGDICLGRNKVMEVLRYSGILTKDNEPMRKYIERGYMQRRKTYTENGKVSYTTVITSSGVNYLYDIVKENYTKAAIRLTYAPNQLVIEWIGGNNARIVTEAEFRARNNKL